MVKVFKLKTWIIFLILMLPAFFPETIVGGILLFIWLTLLVYAGYMLGSMLYLKLPPGHDLKINRFYFNLIFAFGWFAVALIVFEGGYSINQDNYKDYGWSVAIITPMHFYFMYALFYCLYFIAKSIATIEHKRKVKFDEYAGNFFLLFFFPLGIWWMHPKVRRIFSDNVEALPAD